MKISSLAVATAFAGALVIVTSCGDHASAVTTPQDAAIVVADSGAALRVNQPPFVSFTTPANQSVAAQGTAVSFKGSAFDLQDGSLSGASLVWSSSRDGQFGTGTSVVKSNLSAGQHSITLTARDSHGATAQQSRTLTITAPAVVAVSSVSVVLGGASLASGGGTTATATTKDAANNVLTGRVIVWSSSNPAVATVNASTGAVTAVSAGTANIIATSEGKTGQATVTVNGIKAASVSVKLAISSIRATAPIASTTAATATVKDANNNVLTGRVVVWSSSNAAVATVNSSTGAVTGVGTGLANIIATCEGVTALASITVTTPPVATVSVTLVSSLPLLGIATAVATMKDSLTNVLSGRAVSWSSSNVSVASVILSTGLVTAIGSGSANITATSEGRTGTVALAVQAGQVPPAAPPSPGEPMYAAASGVTLVMQDNMERYTTISSLGAYPFAYTAPLFIPNPSPSQTSQPVDTANVRLISPGHGGTGKALQMRYSGAYQESHNLGTFVSYPNVQPDNQTVYVQYYARVTPATNWPLTQPLAVKWLEAWHNHSQTSRHQWNMRYHSSSNTKQTAPTVWQVLDQGESPTNGDQTAGPYFHQIADGQWHRFTHAFRPHASATVKDGFSKMWIDGIMIIDVEKATVGVTPPGGVSAWCSQADVDDLAIADGVAFLNFGGPQTTVTGAWTFDIDDLLWWRK